VRLHKWGERIGQDRVEEEHTQSVLLVTKELSLSGSLSVSGVQSWNVSKTIKKHCDIKDKKLREME
jgi:hypothetical protein